MSADLISFTHVLEDEVFRCKIFKSLDVILHSMVEVIV